jgi:hypothetical protein
MGAVIGVLPVAIYNVYTTNMMIKKYNESHKEQIKILHDKLLARAEAKNIKYTQVDKFR